jgi:hypothetical protein
MAALKRVPSTRCRARPWLDTSMAAACTPASAISASSRWRSGASGVVWTAGRRSSPMRTSTGADDPGDAAGGPEDRLQHVGGGGLAVGAGHPDQLEPVRGVVEEGGGQGGQAVPDPADQQLGGLQVEGPLHAQGGRAGVQGLAGQVVAVDPAPGTQQNSAPGTTLAGVEDDVGDHGRRVAADLALDGRGETCEGDAPGRQGHDLRGPRRRLGRPAAGTPAPASDRHSLAREAARESLASAHRLGR